MRQPTVSLELAKALADNTARIDVLRQALKNTAWATRLSVALQAALDPLLEERENLLDQCFEAVAEDESRGPDRA